MWGTAKTAPTGFIVLNTYNRKDNTPQINTLNSHFKNTDTEECRARRRKEIIAEINEIRNRKTTDEINRAKSWLFRKIDKSDEEKRRTRR